jgi:hypothetical protein
MNHPCPEETPQLLEEALGTSIKLLLYSANGLQYVISSLHNAQQFHLINV